MAEIKNLFERLFSRDYSLSTEIPSNSRFLIVRELEARISKSILPVFLLLEKDKGEQSIIKLKETLYSLTKEGEPIWMLHKFGQFLGAGLIPNPYTITEEQFKAILDANLAKAFSFSKVLDFMVDIVDRFVSDVKDIAELGIDKVARWFKSNINTLTNNAFESGLVDSISDGDDPNDVYVIKIVYPGACKYCRLLYLNADGSPKVFKLSDLLANGSDPYRKPIDYQPVLGALHPNCRCQLARVNPAWDNDKLFDIMTEAWANYAELIKEYEASLTE